MAITNVIAIPGNNSHCRSVSPAPTNGNCGIVAVYAQV